MAHLYDKVKYYLEEENIYLNPKLSLANFSLIVGTNTSYLSGVVNERFGCNLKTLVNRYRIDYAKKVICSHECHLQEIPFLCGFASRSAFYAAFQRFVGMPPMQYMQSQNKRRRKNLRQIIERINP